MPMGPTIAAKSLLFVWRAVVGMPLLQQRLVPHSDTCSLSSCCLVLEGLFITSVCLVLSDASVPSTGLVLFPSFLG